MFDACLQLFNVYHHCCVFVITLLLTALKNNFGTINGTGTNFELSHCHDFATDNIYFVFYKEQFTHQHTMTTEVHCCPNPLCTSKKHGTFVSARGLSSHLAISLVCQNYMDHQPSPQSKRHCITTPNVTGNDIQSYSILAPPVLACHNVNPFYPTMNDTGCFPIDEDVNLESTSSGNPFTTNQPTFVYTCSQKWTIALLKVLDTINAPDHAFGKILAWAKDASSEGYDFEPIGGRVRRKAIENLFPTIKNAQHLLPAVIKVSVPHGPPSEVVAYDFVPQLLSLLQNPNIMTQQNLAIDINDPLKMYKSPNNKLGEAMSGSVYRQAYERMITDPSSQLFVPIIQWIDRTAVTGNERFSLKPYMFTPAIFTAAFRRTLPAWAFHGFLPKPKSSSAENNMKGQGDNLRNYHKQLNEVLQTFIHASDRLKSITLPIGPCGYITVDIVVCLLCVVQDIEEGDRLGGRFGPHQPTIQRQCRTCDINWDNLEDPFVTCHLLQASAMHEIAQSDNALLRQQWSQHKLFNAFIDVPIADPERGIFGAMPVETMHVFRKGMIEKVTFLVLDNVTTKTKATLDGLAIQYHKSHRQSTRKEYPGTDFSNGVTNLTRISAVERVGLVFLFVILSHYDTGWTVLDTILQQKTNSGLADILELLEAMLCFDAWLNKQEHWDLDDEDAATEALTTSIQSLMEMCRHRIPLGKYGQWNFPKFHELLHIPQDMCRLGSPHNYNAERPESLLKPTAKIPGRRAQKTHDGVKYELKSAQQLTFCVIINVVYDKIWGVADNNDDRTDTSVIEDDNITDSYGRGTTAYISLVPMLDNPTKVQYNVAWRSRTHIDLLELPYDLIHFIYQHCEHDVIRISTELVRGGHTFRCHPNYQSSGPQNDWLKIMFEDGDYPCRLCSVIVHESENPTRYQIVVQATVKPTGIKSSIMTEWLFCDDYYLVDTDAIVAPCFVITNISSTFENKVLETLPYHLWASQFTSA